jgi:hypothetical protein
MTKSYQELEAENKALREELAGIRLQDSEKRSYAVQLFRVMTCRDGKQVPTGDLDGHQPLLLRHIGMDEEVNVEDVPWFVTMFAPTSLFPETL